MARRFRKIRYDEKKGQVTLIWEDGKAHEDKYSLECMESPRPEFVQAFKELAKHVAELCELPADYADRITTRSVSLNYGGGYRKRWELCYLLLWSLNKVMACWY